jgi:hypothetical protein
MFTTKSDYVRNYLQQHPEIAQMKRFQIAKLLHQDKPEFFKSPKHADGIVENALKYESRYLKPATHNMPEHTTPAPFGTPQSAPQQALSEAELRAMFDIRQIVRTELDRISEGEFWKDADFTRRFQGKSGYRSILESQDAMPYRGKAGGQVFWGHPRSITKLKHEGILI